MTHEEQAANLEATGQYRVLRRLPRLIGAPVQEPGKIFKGIFTDVESTGLDIDKDEIIELAAVPFAFNADGSFLQFGEPFHTYNEPTKPITEEITDLTGITTDMVKGHRLDTLIANPIFDVDLIIAHNAEFDRQMIERYLMITQKKCWGCSMSGVPWRKLGIRSKRLEHIVTDMGYFYKAHNAVSDCEAGLFILDNGLKDGKTGFHHVLESARALTWHFWTIGLKYDESINPLLKERGYNWSNGNDGRAKAWHREVPDAEKDVEMNWLAEKIYRRSSHKAEARRVTAFDRFSKRG